MKTSSKKIKTQYYENVNTTYPSHGHLFMHLKTWSRKHFNKKMHQKTLKPTLIPRLEIGRRNFAMQGLCKKGDFLKIFNENHVRIKNSHGVLFSRLTFRDFLNIPPPPTPPNSRPKRSIHYLYETTTERNTSCGWRQRLEFKWISNHKIRKWFSPQFQPMPAFSQTGFTKNSIVNTSATGFPSQPYSSGEDRCRRSVFLHPPVQQEHTLFV